MHRKGHDSGGEDIVAHVCVPSGPHALEVVEVHIVLRNGLELVPVGVGGVWESAIKDGGSISVEPHH